MVGSRCWFLCRTGARGSTGEPSGWGKTRWLRLGGAQWRAATTVSARPSLAFSRPLQPTRPGGTGQAVLKAAVLAPCKRACLVCMLVAFSGDKHHEASDSRKLQEGQILSADRPDGHGDLERRRCGRAD